MNKRAFSKIWIIIIIIVLVAGGILVWNYDIPRLIEPRVVLNPEEIESMIYTPSGLVFMSKDITEVVLQKESISIKPGSSQRTKLEETKNYSCKISQEIFNQITKEAAEMVNTAKPIYSKAIPLHSPSYSAVIILKDNKKLTIGSSGTDFINEKPYNIIKPGFNILKQEAYNCLENVLSKLPRDETADWKTYSNPGIDFTFKYPPDWEIKKEYQYKSAACQMDPKCEGVHYVFLNKIDDKRLAETGEKEKFGIAINMPQCTGVKWDYELPGGHWICVFDENSETLDIYEKIKNSFQLIEDKTADWKTYRSEEFGLEMKYPMGLNINEVIKGSEICFTGFSAESPEELVCDFCFYLYPSEGKKLCVENTETGISIGRTPAKKENCCCPEPVNCPGNIMYHFGPNKDNRCIELWMTTTKHGISLEGYPRDTVGIIVPECENIFNQMLSTFNFIE